MSKRPGGLTSLAIFNFIFAGLDLLSVLRVQTVMSNRKLAAEAGLGDTPSWVFLLLICGYFIEIALLVTSGIGYLQQKRKLGRGLGTAYALFALGLVALQVLAIPAAVGASVLPGLVYPGLTLFFLHSQYGFKPDLIRG